MENMGLSQETEFSHESVFLVKNNSKIKTVKELIEKGFIRCPVTKRTLFIIPNHISGEDINNLTFLNTAQPIVKDLKTLKNPALSVVSYGKRIIDHLRRGDVELSSFGKIIIFCFVETEKDNETFINDISFFLSKVTNKATEINYFTYYSKLPIFFSPNTTQIQWKDYEQTKIKETKEIKEIKKKFVSPSPQKENKRMDNRNRKKELDLNEERVKDLLNQTLNYSSPEDLEKAKKLIKKNIPFGRKNYFSAYMLCLLSAKHGNGTKSSQKYTNNPNLVSFYINLGSQDKLNSKTLSEFIINNSKLEKDNIVSLNFKNAYSFFVVEKALSNGVIESLNDLPFGKKKIKVNFANRK